MVGLRPELLHLASLFLCCLAVLLDLLLKLLRLVCQGVPLSRQRSELGKSLILALSLLSELAKHLSEAHL